jgi:hypothetical protein
MPEQAGWLGPGDCLAPLADLLEQLRGGSQLETSREDHDRLQSWRALATLQEADLGPVQVANVSQRLLGEPHALSMAAQVGGELLADGIHASHCCDPQTEGLQTIVDDLHR